MNTRNAFGWVVLGNVIAVGCGRSAPLSTAPTARDAAMIAAGDASTCSAEGPLAGASFDLGRSRFAFGSAPTREDEASEIRYVGSQGVVIVFDCGAELGFMNGDVPEATLRDWSTDPAALSAHVREYFTTLGVESCQIASADVQPAVAGGIPVTIVALTRAVDGIPVKESVAFAHVNTQDQTTGEELFWPTIPAETVAAARALRNRLAEPNALAAFKAMLPASAQGAGQVVIHHGPGIGVCARGSRSMATYDVVQESPMGRTTLSFDGGGAPASTMD